MIKQFQTRVRKIEAEQILPDELPAGVIKRIDEVTGELVYIFDGALAYEGDWIIKYGISGKREAMRHELLMHYCEEVKE